MKVSVLYLQSNEQIARTMKGRFDEGLVEFLIVSTAEEAFAVYEAREITLTLVDAIIPDMKIGDFVSKCHREYPDMILNICMDVKEPSQILSLTSNPAVLKIFVPPWDVDMIVEGVEDSIDGAQIGHDFEKRKRELEKEEVEFVKTLERLKSSLIRQRYSYNRIEPILNSTLKAFIDMSKVDESMAVFIEKTCNRMLVLETATPLKCGDLNDTIKSHINSIGKIVKINKVDSCLMGDVPKSKMADVIMGCYITAMLEALRSSELSVTIDSEYKSSTNVQFTLKAEGKWNNTDVSRQEAYVERILANIMDGFNYVSEAEVHIWELNMQLR